MTKHRYYVVLEDGDVHWTDNTQHAKVFSEDGISIVIDTQLNVTMMDSDMSEIENIVPEDNDEDEEDDSDEEEEAA